VLVDGNDADAVFAAATLAVSRARRGDGPSLVEALTYRHGGHSRADPGKYRPDEEVKAWLERDPIPLYRSRLESLGVGTEQLDSIDLAAAEEVELATEEVLAGSPADPATIWDHVFADGASWRR
jgi:pyruvate dehydrogenase E1 component alpha subunit